MLPGSRLPDPAIGLGVFDLLGLALLVIERVTAAQGAEWRVVRANASASSLTGFEELELIGKRLEDCFPRVKALWGLGALQGVMDTGCPADFQDEAFGVGSTSYRIFDTKVIPLGNALLGLAFRDFTREKELQRLKDDFVSIVSHELRTPLTAIRGTLGLMAGGVLGRLPEQADAMAQIAVRNTDRLIRIINDILDIERIDSGSFPLDKKICDARDLIRHAAESVGSLLKVAEIDLVVDSSGAARLWADPDRIVQTLTNFLSNAIKFSPTGTSISLTAQQAGEVVRFEVRDTGRGIPALKLEAIFDRFVQVEQADMRASQGTGLGLAICKSIAQQHGGRIWAESDLGKGSCFSLELPSLAVPGYDGLDLPDSHPILVCDNDPECLALVRYTLEAAGHSVVTVTSGEQALAQATLLGPRAILVDLHMPQMSGREVATLLKAREETRHLPVAMMSALSAKEAGGMPPEVDDWITKPFRRGGLCDAVEALIAGRVAQVAK